MKHEQTSQHCTALKGIRPGYVPGLGAVLVLLSLLLASCDFRRPDEGYDPNWTPDHRNVSEGKEADRPGGDEAGSPDAGRSEIRPADIVADTAAMEKSPGRWEMVGEIPSEFTVYRKDGNLAMIVEKMGDHTRTYYYNRGALFYYDETGISGGFDLTVEFNDIGDVVGSRWLLDGEKLPVERSAIADIVEHAVELKLRSEEEPAGTGE